MDSKSQIIIKFQEKHNNQIKNSISSQINDLKNVIIPRLENYNIHLKKEEDVHGKTLYSKNQLQKNLDEINNCKEQIKNLELKLEENIEINDERNKNMKDSKNNKRINKTGPNKFFHQIVGYKPNPGHEYKEKEKENTIDFKYQWYLNQIPLIENNVHIQNQLNKLYDNEVLLFKNIYNYGKREDKNPNFKYRIFNRLIDGTFEVRIIHNDKSEENFNVTVQQFWNLIEPKKYYNRYYKSKIF